MRVLFITRKFPPIMGGMEKYSRELYDALSGQAQVDLFANRKGNKALPYFLIAAVARLLVTGRRYDIIHLGDGLLGILIPIARACSAAAVTITIHGLDITYGNPVYRAVVVPRIRTADRVICVSRNTRRLCLDRGISADKISVIPNGITSDTGAEVVATRPSSLQSVVDAGGILCTIGRLVKRKGHEWFIREVMLRLDASYSYLIAGDGPERLALEQAIVACGLRERVFLLGQISEGEKEWLLRTARLFIMPNIPVPGDVEGFGLVLTEAATRGLMSVASDIDGIPDAVVPGETGILARPFDADSFVTAIESARPDRDRVKAAVSIFDWKRIAARYISEMQKAHDIVTSDISRRHRT